MPSWNGVSLPEPPKINIPDSLPKNFNWESYLSDPKGNFNKFKGAREVQRMNWKGYFNGVGRLRNSIVSPSKQMIRNLENQVRARNKLVDLLNTDVKNTKKIAQDSKKLWDNFLSKVKGSNPFSKASSAGGSMAGLLGVGGVAAIVAYITVLQNQVNEKLLSQGDLLNQDLSKTFERSINNSIQVRTLNKKIDALNKEIRVTSDKLYAEAGSAVNNSIYAKKNANDALYEARQGRKILDAQVADAKKQANDALYETRQGRAKLDASFADLKLKTEQSIKTIQTNFTTSVNTTIASIQKGLQEAKLQAQSANSKVDLLSSSLVKAQATITNVSSIANNAISTAKSALGLIQNIKPVDTKPENTSDTNQLKNQVNNLVGKITGLEAALPTLTNAIPNLASNISKVDAKAEAALKEAKNKGVPDFSYAEKQLNAKFDTFTQQQTQQVQQSEQTTRNYVERKFVEEKYAQRNFINESIVPQIQATATATTGVKAEVNQIKQDFSGMQRQVDNSSAESQRVSLSQSQIQSQVTQLSGDIQKVQQSNSSTKTDLNNIETRLKQQEKVNEQALPKLDNIITLLGLIPARAAGMIKPDIPTIPQIENAAATGMCRTTQTGGCSRKMMDDAVGNINNNTNNATGNAANTILGGINAAENTAQLEILNTINNKLGAQLPGGLAGKMSRLADWLHLDRVLNILIFAATVHNALMLSNDIGQTLLGAINNVLTLIGLKKEDGSAFDLGSVISGSIENLIKGIVGAENYTQLKAAWEQTNRIYQATTNALNQLMNVNAVITNALEVIGSYTGKIGNALRMWGVIGEKAYSWMNPQPSFDNKWITKLQQLQQGASSVAMVSQIPIDTINAVTELNNSTTELVKAVKQEPNTKDGVDVGEAAKVKQEREAAKAVSFTLPFDITDLFDGDD